MKYVQPYLKSILDDLAVLQDRLPKDKEAFTTDTMLQDATMMRLIDIGEHFVRIREGFPEFYEQHENEAWHKIIGVRNIIAHGYHEVNLDNVWDIISSKLDELTVQLNKLVTY